MQDANLDVHFHLLRHAHASALIKNGVDVQTVSTRLGHSTASTTLNLYVHTLAGADESAAQVFDKPIANLYPVSEEQAG